MMIVSARMMSGTIFTFELDNVFFIYKVKKLKYLLSRELRQLPSNIIIYKDQEQIDDSDILKGEEYTIFVNN
jgi:hypothetical protein